MDKKTRVLVVDDSVVIRRVLGDVLASDPRLQVAGYAANGRIALSLLDQVSPDIVILDVEMPDMNGLEVLSAIRERRPGLPVIMFSTLTERGAEATIDALALGATDYVTKPSAVGSLEAAKERIRQQLIPKIKTITGLDSSSLLAGRLGRATCARQLCPPLHRRGRKIDIVAIGASTGGPNALASVLGTLPASFPVPVVVVQHMPPTFTRFLAQRLSTVCALKVREAVADNILAAGDVWIAPGDFHLSVIREGTKAKLVVDQAPPENSCRPSVDVLFRSVARVFGGSALAVVLTGMGQDGLRGCEELARDGADIIVQDEASSVVWGMPGFVARADLANDVIALPQMGDAIVRRVNASGTRLETSAISAGV